MLRHVLLALLVASTALAGCLEAPGATDATPAGTPPAPLAANASAWHVLSVRATPEAGLAGFWWTVPEGAPVEDAFFSTGDEPRTSVVLEAALLDEDDLGGLQEWALLAFVKEDGELYPLAEAVATPVHARAPGLLGGEEETFEVSPRPFFLRLGPDAVEAGDKVGFVLAARAAQPQDVRLGFRVMPEDPGFEEEPVDDAEGFLAARGGAPPVPLRAAGEGQGLQAAAYLDFEGLFPFAFGVEMWTDAVTMEGGVSPDLRPAVAVRDQTLSASFGSPAGYAAAMGAYWAEGATGTWEAEADVRGGTLSTGGPVVEAGTASVAGYLLFGFPAFVALGDGEGASASSLHVETTAVDAGGFEVLVFSQMDLGAPLATLLGEDGMTETATFEGVLPRAGLLVDHRDVTLLSEDGHHRTLLGVAPPA